MCLKDFILTIILLYTMPLTKISYKIVNEQCIYNAKNAYFLLKLARTLKIYFFFQNVESLN